MSAAGGMHHCSFRHGLSSLFEHPPNRLGRDGVHDGEFDQLVRQELQGPLCAARRPHRAGQSDQRGLRPAVELARPAWLLLRLAAQGSRHALLDAALAHAFDGGGIHVEGLGDPQVGPGRAAPGRPGLEQTRARVGLRAADVPASTRPASWRRSSATSVTSYFFAGFLPVDLPRRTDPAAPRKSNVVDCQAGRDTIAGVSTSAARIVAACQEVPLLG